MISVCCVLKDCFTESPVIFTVKRHQIHLHFKSDSGFEIICFSIVAGCENVQTQNEIWTEQ